MVSLQIVFDLGLQAVADHIIAHIDGGCEPFGIGAAMALDDHAVQAEEDAAIDLAWVHLLAQAIERALGENIADLGHQRA